MKATGIVRRSDDLRRAMIPKKYAEHCNCIVRLFPYIYKTNTAPRRVRCQFVEKVCILFGSPNHKRRGIDRRGEKTLSGFLSPSPSFSRFWKEKEISRSAERMFHGVKLRSLLRKRARQEDFQPSVFACKYMTPDQRAASPLESRNGFIDRLKAA